MDDIDLPICPVCGDKFHQVDILQGLISYFHYEDDTWCDINEPCRSDAALFVQNAQKLAMMRTEPGTEPGPY